jgi:hypothetical protein
MTYTQVWDAMNNKPHDSIIVRDEDGAFIPMDPDNVDCQDYLTWLDAGNVPRAAMPPATTLPETAPVEDRVADLETRVDALESDDGRHTNP